MKYANEPLNSKVAWVTSSSLVRIQYDFVGQFTSSYLLNKRIASTNFVCVQANGHNLKDANSHQMFTG